MAATIFATPINNISTRLGSAHAAGLRAALGRDRRRPKFPPLASPAYYRVTVLHAAVAYQPYVDPANYAIFKVTQIQGDDLIVSGMLDGIADKTFNIGDVVEIRVTRRDDSGPPRRGQRHRDQRRQRQEFHLHADDARIDLDDQSQYE